MSSLRVQAFVLTSLCITGLSLSGVETWTLELPDAVISHADNAKVRAGLPVVRSLLARNSRRLLKA
jgi:hypothetical protein